MLFLTVGDTVKQYYWNGAEWVTNPVVSDVEAFKEQIAEELKDVPDREEFENKISEEIANSKAEIGTQIETAKTQAETNAKAYADEINQITAGVAEQAKTAADEIKADLVNVKSNLTSTSIVANNAQASVDEAKQDLIEVASELNTAKQDLMSHAQQLQTQANAQTELTNRVTTVETTANGTKTTVNELTKTVAQNGKDIVSVTNRTKTVEDDLANTKTTLTQVQTTADSTSQKTATLETGLNGVKADLTATTMTANTTKQNLASYQASNDKVVASLKSSLQTTDGNVSNLQTKVEAVPGQITSAVSSVEGKIPTEIGSSNLLRNTAVNTENLKLFGKTDTTVSVVEKDGHQVYKLVFYGSSNAGAYFDGNSGYYNLVKDRNYTFSFWVLTNKDKNFNFNSLGHIQAVNTNGDNVGNDILHQHTQPVYSTNVIKANTWTKVWCTFKATSNSYFKPYFWYLTAGDEIYIYDMMLNEGKIPLSYTPAVEDTVSQISTLNTTLTQTAEGLTQLSTKVDTQGSTITSHTNSINSLSTGLSAKVSQTDFNTLSGRVTAAENNITANAGELSSKITSLEGKLPSGEMNLVEYGRPADGYSPYSNAQYTTHSFYYNGAYKMYILRNTNTSKIFLNLNRFKIERNTDYTLYFKGFNNALLETAEVYFLKRKKGSTSEYDEPQRLLKRKLSAGAVEEIIVTFNTGEYDEGYIRIDNNGTSTAGSNADLYFGDVSVKKGKSNSGWSPSLAELASSQDLKTAQSEFKQTTDSIKASVQSLDNNTVKSSSLTINTDGVVIKAGKSPSDFANAIGSYFSVNQNAINLFSDKINVKGNMIVSGAITSDKIASKQINTAHLNGKIITADVISSNAVTADAIKAGAVTTDKMSANSINGDRITAGTLDAAKIKAGSITASQIASGTITSAQIKAGTISAANIAAGAITSDKIASNSIDASKIAANAISANMITGGQLRSTNGATVFDLNAGTLTFNNDRGYIQRVASDKIFEITTYLGKSLVDSRDYLTSAFNVRKSDNSRKSGIRFSLYNMVDNKPTSTAEINSDTLTLYDSQSTMLFSVNARSTWLGNFNMQGWGDIPVAQIYGGLIVKDIGIGGHMKSLLKIVEELCNKTGVMWI